MNVSGHAAGSRANVYIMKRGQITLTLLCHSAAVKKLDSFTVKACLFNPPFKAFDPFLAPKIIIILGIRALPCCKWKFLRGIFYALCFKVFTVLTAVQSLYLVKAAFKCLKY